MSLKEYRRKRDFEKTAEPTGKKSTKAGAGRFVIQKHAASHLHYDFRLELDGVLKSWAVPKGIPFTKGEKRLAIQVEDHPVSYIDFEGIIPEGQYGGGTVMVWDRGTYEPVGDPTRELAGGKLHFVLDGKKLHGEWYLVRLRDGKQWLLIRGHSDMRPISKKMDDTSALSGKSMSQLAQGTKVWQSSRPTATSGVSRHRPQMPRLKVSSSRPRRAVAEGENGERARVSGEQANVARLGGRVRMGTATPHFIEPMKARLVDAMPEGDWIYEIKLDGFRALAVKQGRDARLLSRNEKDLGKKFPEVLAAVKTLPSRSALIDGEIVALDARGRSSFQLLQAYDLGEERPPIFYYVFDLLHLDGRDLKNEPLIMRKQMLENLVPKTSGVIRFSASLEDSPAHLLEHARSLGLEGLVGKQKDSRYEPGRRSGVWVKIKLHHEQEMVIGGYTNPEGARSCFGALLVGHQGRDGLLYAGKVGTGFDEPLLRALHRKFKSLSTARCPFINLPEKRIPRHGQAITASVMKRCHWVKPKLVGQIKFSEWTRDGKLRQPVFLGLRDDKSPKDVVRENPQ